MSGMGGSSTTNTNSSTTPDAQLLSAYRGLLPQAQAAANSQYDPRTGQRVAGFSDAQNQYFGGVSNLQGYGSTGMQGAINQMGASSAPLSADSINQYMNPYTQDVINSSLTNLGIEQGKAQAGVQAGAIAQNALGGNRATLQADDLQRQQDLAKGSMVSGLESQAYQQAVNTATQQQNIGMQGAQGLAGLYGSGQNLTLQQLGALGSVGAQQQGLTQAQYDAATKNAQSQFMLPYQNAQFLSGILGSANMGSTTTGSSTTTQNPGAAQIAGTALGAMAMFSDERLKDDIEHIGYSFGGKPIYSYRMKGEPAKQLGFMAQDIERTHPHAVGHIGGLKTVNYDTATRDDVAKGHFADGGAAGGPNVFGDMGNASFMPWSQLGRAAPLQAPQQAAAPAPSGGGFAEGLKQSQDMIKSGQGAKAGLSNLNQKLGDAVYGGGSGQGPGGWGASVEPASFTQGLGLGFAGGGDVSVTGPENMSSLRSLGHIGSRGLSGQPTLSSGEGGVFPHSVFGRDTVARPDQETSPFGSPDLFPAFVKPNPLQNPSSAAQPTRLQSPAPMPTAPDIPQAATFAPSASPMSLQANPFNPRPIEGDPQSPSGGMTNQRFAPMKADGGGFSMDPAAFSKSMVNSKAAGLGGLSGNLGGAGAGLLGGFASGGGVRGFDDGGTPIALSRSYDDESDVKTIDQAPIAASPINIIPRSQQRPWTPERLAAEPPPSLGPRAQSALDTIRSYVPSSSHANPNLFERQVLGAEPYPGASKAPPPSVQTAQAAQPPKATPPAGAPQGDDVARKIAEWTAQNPLPTASQPAAPAPIGASPAGPPVGKIQLNPEPAAPVRPAGADDLTGPIAGAVPPLPNTEPAITTEAASKVTPVHTTREGVGAQPVKTFRVYPTTEEKAGAAAPTESPKQFSPEGLAKLEEFEGGYQLKPFKDANATSIGLGTRARPGDEAGITEQEARRRATEETTKLSDHVNASARVPLSQTQHDALVRFGFQEGQGALDKVVKTLNTEGPEAAAARMQRYVYAEDPSTGELRESPHIKMRMAYESGQLTGNEPETAQIPARHISHAARDETGNVKLAKPEAKPEGDFFTRNIGFNPLQPFTGVAPGSTGWNPMGWTPQQQEKLAAFGLGMAGNIMSPFQGAAEGLQRGQEMQLKQGEFGLKSMMEPAKLSLEAEKIRQGRYIVHQTGVDTYGFPIYTTLDTKTGLPVHAAGVSPGALGGSGAPGLGQGQSGGFQAGQLVGSNVHGEEFLKTIPPQYAARIKAEGDYDAPPSPVTNDPKSIAYNALLRQYRPDFDTTGFKQKQDTVKDFQTGEARKAIDAGRTAIGHIGEFSDAFEGMGNSNIPVVNRIRNWVAEQTGSNRTSAVDAIKGSLSSELAKFYKGASPTGHEAEEAMALLDSAKSPEQMRTALVEVSKMMGNRVRNLEARRDQVNLDPNKFKIWTPTEERILDKINARKAGQTIESEPERRPVAAPAQQPAASIMPRPNKSEAEIIADAKEYLRRPGADIPALAAHLRAWGIDVNKIIADSKEYLRRPGADIPALAAHLRDWGIDVNKGAQ